MEQQSTTMPLISVMMPARNEEKYISGAIDSIVRQTYRNWELLIVDDKSQDDTKKIALGYAAKDSRIRVIDGDGVCAANARNKAIDLAQGDYMLNMDSDDLSIPERMETLVEVAVQVPERRYAVIGSNLWNINARQERLSRSHKPLSNAEIRKKLKKFVGREAIYPQTALFSSNLLKRYQYREFYRSMEDWDLVLRLAEDQEVVFGNVDEPLYLYHLNQGSMTLNPAERIKYNLLVRYNELMRKRRRREITSIERFEEHMRSSLPVGLLYTTLIWIKRFQNYVRFNKYKSLSVQ